MKRFVFVIFLPFLFVPINVFAITYDMVVDASSIVTAPSKPHIGQLAKVYVIVTSIGKEDVEGIVVFNDGDKLIGRKSISLKAGGSDEDVWTTWFPTVSGTHLIRVNVVNDPGYPDASPENNHAERAIVVEGDPETKPQTTSTTTSVTATTTAFGSSSITTSPASSRTTQKTRTPLVGQQTSPRDASSGQNTKRSQTARSQTATRAREENTRTQERENMKTREASPAPVADTTTHTTLVMERTESASPTAFEHTLPTITAFGQGGPEQPLRRHGGDVGTALWIGAAISALLALLFYFVARRKDRRSSD